MAFKSAKKFLVFASVISILSLAAFALVFAAAPPPKVCGDRIIQSPNDEGKFEKCDDGGDSARCTAACGQKLLGWGFADNGGWVSLNHQTCEAKYLDPSLPPEICSYQTVAYYTQVTADNEVEGWAWSDNLGWICFGTACGGSPPFGNLAAAIDLTDPDKENPAITGWAKITGLGDNGWVSLNCANDPASCEFANYQVRLSSGSFGGETRLTLKGWAWNDLAGWLWFSPEIAQISPWLQTKYSDIYARFGLLGNKPPYNACNATFRILASDAISNFCSSQGASWVSGEFSAINFPAPETQYSNVLGKIDVDSLLCDFNGNPTCLNRFGATVVDVAHPAFQLTNPFILGGKIYYLAGDLPIGGLTFGNGANFASGAGAIIIDGNVDLTGDITYEPSGLTTSFKNLASAAWIVRGDLRISPAVKQLAGNFIVLGNGQRCDPVTPGCGQIYSCCQNDGSGGCLADSCGERLTVSGLMMARKFYFERTYINPHEAPVQGSELIIYDGRLLANTPPGLSDFAKALPIWRAGSQ